MKFARAFYLLAIVSLLGACPATAQPAEDPASGVRYWGQAGPAVTTLGLGASAVLAVEFEHHMLSLRSASTHPSFGAETWDAGLLYGRAVFVRSFVVSGSTGVAVVGGRRYGGLFGGSAEERLEPMIGFPLEGQLSWTPSGVVAIGLRGFANVNTEQPFGGLGLSLRVGNLR